MSKRILCKFFVHGACLKGEHCEFSHDKKDAPNNICTYYQKGICSYGSRCRYDHVKFSRAESASSSSAIPYNYLLQTSSPAAHTVIPASSGGPSVTYSSGPGELSASSKPYFPPTKPAWNSESLPNNFSENGFDRVVIEPRHVKPEDRSICSFAAAGLCPRGDKCPHIHGDLCPTCGKHCLHPLRPLEREEHLKTCKKKQRHLEALKQSQEIECCVCLDRVLSKHTAAERKFGLLSECDHPFCISCIRNWRNSSPNSGMDLNTALRTCPICRKLSYFVVPSVIWYSSKEEKQEIIDNYKEKLSSIDCKHFDYGNGNCPFGTSCFYKHSVKAGSYTWKYQRPPPRRQRSNIGNNMDEFFDVVEHLIEDADLDIFDADDYDDYTLDDYILENYDDYTLEGHGDEEDCLDFLFMQMHMGSCDTSSDEGNWFP